MRSTSSSATLGLLLAACTFAPAPAQPRPSLPAPSIPAVAAPELAAFDRPEPSRLRGRLAGAGETVTFELWRAPLREEPRPLVLLVPILAGGAALMAMVAGELVDRGFDVAWCERVAPALAMGQRAPDLQVLFERTVLHQRLLLAWLRGPDQPPAAGTFVLGISLGGMVATALMALEPSLDGVALCLAGGGLDSLVVHSGERRVQRWVEWRQREDGLGAAGIGAEFATWLRWEPVAMAAAIPTGKVLLVSAAFDDVVPVANQDLLWEALGRPARLTVPLGHYGAAVAMGRILDAAAGHFADLE